MWSLCFHSDEADVASSLDDVYNVGTFVQINEIHDIGDRMRMVIQGHRRYASLLFKIVVLFKYILQLGVQN